MLEALERSGQRDNTVVTWRTTYITNHINPCSIEIYAGWQKLTAQTKFAKGINPNYFFAAENPSSQL